MTGILARTGLSPVTPHQLTSLSRARKIFPNDWQAVSHYRIVEKLAGGMGVVFMAEDLELGRFLALKFLPDAEAAVDARSILSFARSLASGLAEGGPMFRKIKPASPVLCALVLGSTILLAQAPKDQKVPGAAASSTADTGTSAAQVCAGCELPIILRQNVEAGKTAVGTKVESQLVMATMMKGGVLPKGAVISGEVIESVAKSDKSPSRLAIRMDSARWKNGEAKFKGYLTAWYYPPAPMPPPDLSYTPPGERRNWGQVDPTVDTTDPPNPAQRLSTQRDNSANADAPASFIAKNRVLMKNVQSASGADGSVVLVSSRSKIKLDKVTTYVLAVDELLPGK